MSSAFDTKIILINLLKIYNQSGHEKYISAVILRWLKKHNIDFKIDKVGNIYNFKYPGAPFLNAHLDSVQRDCDKMAGLNLTINSDLIIKSEGHIIGGDDLVGVYIILYLLGNTNLRFNWIFTVSEEVSGIGSTAFANENPKLLTDSAYGLVIDRKGKDDIVCSNNNYGTQEFQDKLALIGKSFQFSPGTGTWSDADKWKSFVSCANLSCGYYEAHTVKEYVKLEEVFNTINYIKAILSTVKEKFEKPKITYNRNSIYGSIYDDWYDDWYGYSGGYQGSYQKEKQRRINDKYDKKTLFDEDEVLEEEEEEEIRKCIACEKNENFQTDYYNEHIWVSTLSGYVCNNCILELYDELSDKLAELGYY